MAWLLKKINKVLLKMNKRLARMARPTSTTHLQSERPATPDGATSGVAAPTTDSADTSEVDPECLTCGEDPEHKRYPLNECSHGKRPCGHHCNCSWVHDHCHWCGAEFLGEDEVVMMGTIQEDGTIKEWTGDTQEHG